MPAWLALFRPYQWVKNGVPINAPSSPFLVLRNVAASDAGTEKE